MKPERDIYFQKAIEEGYLARSAYKLLQIDDIFKIFEGVTKVIDLCSAPGSWTQVIYNKLHKVQNNYDPSRLNADVKIMSVDMMPMDHFPGVMHLEEDISKYSTMKMIMEKFDNEKVDLIVCDGAIDVIGMNIIDYFMHHHIFLSALYVVLNTLKTGGKFIIKIFIDKGDEKIIAKLNLFFQEVCVVKPHSSRNKEAFAVCCDYLPIPEFDPIQLTPFIELKNSDFSELTGIHKELIPYICADCSIYRSTKNSIDDLNLNEDEKFFFDSINIDLTDIQEDILMLKKRVLQKPPVYRITKDNQLEYDPETHKMLFHGFMMNEINHEVENITTEDVENITIEDVENITIEDVENTTTEDEDNCAIPSSSESHVVTLENNCDEFDKKRNMISEILSGKIKSLEAQNKGKYSGLGFNLNNWQFFVSDMANTHTEEVMENQSLRDISKGFEGINEKIKNRPKIIKPEYIKNLFLEYEKIKAKIRNSLLETDDDEDFCIKKK